MTLDPSRGRLVLAGVCLALLGVLVLGASAAVPPTGAASTPTVAAMPAAAEGAADSQTCSDRISGSFSGYFSQGPGGSELTGTEHGDFTVQRRLGDGHARGRHPQAGGGTGLGRPFRSPRGGGEGARQLRSRRGPDSDCRPRTADPRRARRRSDRGAREADPGAPRRRPYRGDRAPAEADRRATESPGRSARKLTDSPTIRARACYSPPASLRAAAVRRGCSVRWATTSWTQVLAAREAPSTEARLALEALCRAYWYPLYAFVRRLGESPEDASDLTRPVPRLGESAGVVMRAALIRPRRARDQPSESGGSPTGSWWRETHPPGWQPPRSCSLPTSRGAGRIR